MNIDKGIVSAVADIAQKYPQIKRVVLFGSRARGDNRKTSDIDLAVYAAADVSEFIYAIEAEVDTLLTFDVSIADDTLDPIFLLNIAAEGVCIYEQLEI